MKLNTINATYGGYNTPCTLYTATDRNGGTWYAVDGSKNVNYTYTDILPGCDIEELPDADTFTWPDGIHSEEELESAIDA